MGLFGKITSFAKRLGNMAKNGILSFTNSEGGWQNVVKNFADNPIQYMKKIGKTALDSLAEKAINWVYDKSKGFASNTLDRKAPMLVKPFENGAEALKNNLTDKYKELLWGKNN